MEKSAEELYKERSKRVEDAIRLQVPDRVPVAPFFSFFYAKYAGLTPEEAFYDYEKWRRAIKKTIADFQPDMYLDSRFSVISPGPLLDIADCKQIKWPGHGVSPNHYSFQHIEAEYMKEDEYDAFLFDPSDYVVRTYLPRLYGVLEPLKMLPPLHSMLHGYVVAYQLGAAAKRQIIDAFEALSKANAEYVRWGSEMNSLREELNRMGFPSWSESIAQAPFDIIGDFLRGFRGVVMDMYRRPDKLIEATEKILPMQLQRTVFFAKRTGNPRVYIPLDLGSDGFMSLQQFKTFYWPTAKKLIIGLINEGITPWLHFEANYLSRLEIMTELPKGKTICHFERPADIFRAKEILGDIACLKGGVPNSLLCTGTPDDVKEHCKKLIDVVGKAGGFIMDAGAAIGEAKPENLKAMIDFTKEYGVYS